MVQAGQFREKVTLSKRATTPDDYGNDQAGWVDQFTVPARIQPLRGGEQVMAARLESKQPYAITLRYSTQTQLITSDWRVVDARDATREFAIHTVTHDERKRTTDLLVEQGVALG